MERMDKGDLLHIGTAYVEVHTFKGNDYVTVKDFSITTNALSKEILELEEENKNLKKKIELLDNENMGLNAEIKDREEENKKLKSNLSECECSMHFENDEVGYRKRECKKLKEELKELEDTLEHRDSVLSIMYDLLRSDLSDYEQLCMIDVVIDVEVGNEPQNKLREELLDRFWKRDF